MRSIKFVSFDLPAPKSFDPLQADNGVNLNAMRMLYLTPLELSLDNQLTSTILDSFSYDKESKTITFKVNQGRKYSDGSLVTTDDVLLSITRMAAARPKFPVLKDIAGIQEWVNLGSPLKQRPYGISINGSEIKIKLIKPQSSPLFRFTLELFSIIPSRCIDFSSGKMTCDIAPFSGYYRMKQKQDNLIHFEKRDEYACLDYEKHISFIYTKPTGNDLKKYMESDDAIIYGMDLRLKDGTLKDIPNNLQFEWLPSSRFVYLSINPNVKPFDEINCRRFFMKEFRNTVQDFYKNDLEISSSIFTPIMSGYLSNEDLSASIEQGNGEECLSAFEKSKIPWQVSDPENLGFSEKLLFETMRKIDPSSKPIVSKSEDREDQFVESKNAFYAGSSAFWAENPIGDLQMFFTRGLHKSTVFATEMTQLERELESLDEYSDTIQEDLKRINRTLFDESLLNIFLHSRRFFASHNENLLSPLTQTVSPAFYQVIK